LDAIEYLQGDNWLGVALAALMRIAKDQVAPLGAEALRRIQSAPLSEQQRFLLGECVQAYLPMDEEATREFERLLTSEKYHGVQAMNTTSYEKGLEKGIEKGIEKGLEKGQREILRMLIDERFGPVSPAVLERIEQLPAAQLKPLGKALVRAQSLRDLGLED